MVMEMIMMMMMIVMITKLEVEYRVCGLRFDCSPTALEQNQLAEATRGLRIGRLCFGFLCICSYLWMYL